jgi:hypothetical protein
VLLRPTPKLVSAGVSRSPQRRTARGCKRSRGKERAPKGGTFGARGPRTVTGVSGGRVVLASSPVLFMAHNGSLYRGGLNHWLSCPSAPPSKPPGTCALWTLGSARVTRVPDQYARHVTAIRTLKADQSRLISKGLDPYHFVHRASASLARQRTPAAGFSLVRHEYAPTRCRTIDLRQRSTQDLGVGSVCRSFRWTELSTLRSGERSGTRACCAVCDGEHIAPPGSPLSWRIAGPCSGSNRRGAVTSSKRRRPEWAC